MRASFPSASPRPSRTSPAAVQQHQREAGPRIDVNLRQLRARRGPVAIGARTSAERLAKHRLAGGPQRDVLLAGDAGDDRQPVRLVERRALERAAVRVQQVERAHQRAGDRVPLGHLDRPAPTAARAARARTRSRGAMAQLGGDASRVDRQQPIAELARPPAPGSRRPTTCAGRARPRTSRTANRGDAIDLAHQRRPASTDAGDERDHHQHLADDQQLAADPARARLASNAGQRRARARDAPVVAAA